MSTFEINLSTINPKPEDVIVLQLDVDNIPYSDLDDFSDMQEKLKQIFPKNKILLLAKSDHLRVCHNKEEIQYILNGLS